MKVAVTSTTDGGLEKILHVTQRMPPRRGGTETYIDAASLPFVARGHSVTQLGSTSFQDQPASMNPHPGDPRIVQYKTPQLATTALPTSMNRPANPAYLAPLIPEDVNFYRDAVGRVVELFAPDVVFVHMVGPALAQAVLEVTPSSSRCFYVPHVSNANPTEPRSQGMTQAMQLKGWSAVLASSKWHRRRIQGFDRPTVPVQVVYPGVDTSTFANPATHPEIDRLRKPGQIWVMSPARIVDMKGQIDFVRAMPVFTRMGYDVQFVIPASDEFAKYSASASSSERALFAEADRLGVRNRLHLLPLAGPSMAAADHSCDVIYVGSRQGNGLIAETFCIGAMEALAAGRPLASTLSGGISDYLKDGVNGVVIPVGSDPTVVDPEAIVDSVLRARYMRDHLAVAGPATAAQFSHLAFTNRLESLMDMGNSLPAL